MKSYRGAWDERVTFIRARFFTRRITNAWNSPPEDVMPATTLNIFKNRLDEVWINFKYCTDLFWFKNPTLKMGLMNHYLQCNLSSVVSS